MKNFKKFAAMISALSLAACAAAPVVMNVSATQVSVDVTQDAESHTYTASQIFAGTYNDNGLKIDGWGVDINVDSLIAADEWKNFVVVDAVDAVGDDPLDPDYVAAVPAVTIGTVTNDAAGAGAAAQKIEKIGNDADKAAALAKVIAKYLKTTTVEEVTTVKGTTLSGTAVDLAAGYYIVSDSYTSSDSDGTWSDSISNFILKVSGGTTPISITPKKDKPTVTKKVWENNDTNVNDITAYSAGGESAKNWNDVADYSIGDEISFKLYGTLPSNLNSYTNGYKYVFHDEIDSQFTLVDGDDADTNVDVIVMIGNNNATGYEVAQTGNSFTVTFENILNGNTIADPENTLVTVEYKAKLNSTANIGPTGQENKVYLEYSNNPNWSGDGNNTTDETERDEVVVFTYELDSTKVDGATQATLDGAKFVLKNSSKDKYAKVENGCFVKWTTEADATVLESDSSGLFNVKGLDEGTYYIEEKEAPANYNALTTDVAIVVTATTLNGHSYNGTPSSALTKFVYKYGDAAQVTQDGTAVAIDGKATGKVENNKGTELPSTGGIGTTLFYLGGGAMVAVAGVFLITKKRMGKNEE